MLPSSLIVVSTDQVSTELEGEAVILNLKSGVYFGLNPLGAFVWQKIQQPARVLDIRDAILAEYDIDPQRCEEDLMTLLGGMLQAGLIEVVSGTAQ